jgi:hypothetical protein
MVEVDCEHKLVGVKNLVGILDGIYFNDRGIQAIRLILRLPETTETNIESTIMVLPWHRIRIVGKSKPKSH